MKNNYKIIDETVYIEAHVKGEVKEVLISLSDFEKVSKLNRKIGINNGGYAVFHKQNKQFTLHRFLNDFPEDLQVDHINANKLDNRKENFRLVDNKTNSNNVNNNYKVGQSGTRWVLVHKGRRKPFQVRFKSKSYGYFVTLEEAKEVVANLIKQESQNAL